VSSTLTLNKCYAFFSSKGKVGNDRWVDNIKMDLTEIRRDGVDWIDMTQNRDQCRVLVTTVMNLRVP
jgi:hypothetical protein